ncbi:hypothetical protein C1646_775566 [Rhizophagus diaphanus]|nr:hypothetical protein C1646_775566 [Rhizophagus diaphanus] [Rhizophagus sp. MUCL 43196]
MSSQASSPASPDSITEEISTRIMSDVVKEFNTEELIEYLGRKDLKLDEDDIKILHKEKIAGLDFLNTTKEVMEMLRKNKVNGEDITSIKQFTPVFEEINDDDKALDHCMEDIILKLSNVETMTNANEDVSDEDAIGRVDYAIKSLEDFLCITKGKPQNIKIGYAQCITELEAKNDKLEAENAELRKGNTEIRDLRFKLSVSDAEIAELKRMRTKVLRANGEHNERRDVEIKKLKQKNAELEARLAIVEKNYVVVDGQLQNDKKAISEVLPKISSPNNNVDIKSSEDKKMDSFLDEVHKKKVSNEIRQRNREKKLLRESSTKDLSVSKGPVSSVDEES